MSREHSGFSEVTFNAKFTNEQGCICNEIIFTSGNGGRLFLTLFDVKPLNEDNLDESYYRAAEETLSRVPAGFPPVYSIMYTEESAAKCGAYKGGTDGFLL